METRSAKSYIIVLATVNILLAGLSVFLLFDLLNNRLVEVDRLNAELVSLRNLNARANSIEKVIKETKDARDRLDLYFITKETVSNFIGELESLALHEGVVFDLTALAIAKEKAGSKASYLKLDLGVDGEFSNVFHFLKVLESMPYKLRFNSVKIEKTISLWSAEVSVDLISYIDK